MVASRRFEYDPHLGAFAHDARVTKQRQFHVTGHFWVFDCADHGLGEYQARRPIGVRGAGLAHIGIAVRSTMSDWKSGSDKCETYFKSPGAERPAFAVKDRDACVAGLKLGKGRVQRGGAFQCHGVSRFGAAVDDGPDVVYFP